MTRANGQSLAVLAAAQRALPTHTTTGARGLLAFYWCFALRFGEAIQGRHQTFADLFGSSERSQQRWTAELIKAGALVSRQTPRGRRVEMAPGWKGWPPTVTVGAANSGGPKSPTRTERDDAECVARSDPDRTPPRSLDAALATRLLAALEGSDPRRRQRAECELTERGWNRADLLLAVDAAIAEAAR